MEINIANLFNFNVQTDLSAMTKQTQTDTKSGGSFSSQFNNLMDKREAPAPKQASRKKTENATNPVERRADNRVENRQNTRAEPVKDTKTAETEEVQKSPEQVTAKQSDEDNSKMIETIAAALGVSANVIKQTLENLSMTVEDLKDPKCLIAFMKDFLNADSLAALLVDPQAQDVMKTISNALTEFDATMQSATENAWPEHINIDAENSGLEEEANVMQQAGGAANTDGPHVLAKSAENNANGGFQNSQNGNFAQTSVETTNQHTDINTMNTTAFIDKVETVITETKNLPSNISAKDVVKQMTELIKADVRSSTTELKMTLRPAQLGEVTLKIISENGLITAQFVAENQRIKEIIETNFNHLKDALLQQGIQISELNVTVSQEQSDSNMQQFMQQRNSSGSFNGGIKAEAGIPAEDAASDYANPYDVSDSQVDFSA